MNFKESFLTALAALVANKLRALLTMLGIIIGVAAVITMIAIGEGAQKAVIERIQSLGSNLLFVSPGAQRGGGVVVVQFGTSVRLKNSDAEAIAARTSAVEAVVPEFSRQAQVKYENRNWNTRIVGTTPEYETARNFRAFAGRYFTHSEERGVAKVCLLGQNVVESLFPTGDPIGKTIRISGQSFQVIGILESKGQSGWQSPDDQIIVPLSTAQRRIFGVDFLSQISVKVANELLMDEAFLDIERIIRREHKLREEQDNDFSIRNQADIISTFEETQRTFTFLLAGIAAVSLLVGGIGIMNIMIVSVTERTKEIGIRKAIGARRRDIMSQFLIESVVMSISGGCLGIGVGILASYLITTYGNLTPIISVNSIAVSFVFASLVGIFFGIYPAWKAAMSNVIDALRYE
ncbi:MAG TPA: multidrug ABC transporter substrate-binding protein [Bacteroidetes bacterium]|nr:multidrug ABC transporter substrate-binding protein [Bacteroidota bacterium]